MRQAFLLRFVEPCLEEKSTPLCGTKTETRNRGEAADNDPQALSYLAMPRLTAIGARSDFEREGNRYNRCSRSHF
jgi:hypothetical protein